MGYKLDAGMTHYEVLGVHPGATIDQIKQSYHAAILRHHPDKTVTTVTQSPAPATAQIASDTSDAFQLIQTAWEVRGAAAVGSGKAGYAAQTAQGFKALHFLIFTSHHSSRLAEHLSKRPHGVDA